MLMVIDVIWRISKPASCRRCAARWTRSGGEKKLATVAALILSCPSNIDTPPIERGDARAKMRSGTTGSPLAGFLAAVGFFLRAGMVQFLVESRNSLGSPP